MMKKLQWMAIVTAGSLGLTACGGGGSGSASGSASGSTSGTLSVHMTDNPACGFDHVYVTVKQVRVNANANATDNDTGWYTVNLSTPKRVDLLSLTNGVLADLGQTPLPTGKYEQVRLVLDSNTGNSLANSVVPTGGTEQGLTTPSATQSGYKVVGNFEVKADTLVDLVLDFDACRSVVKRGNGSYSLKPVVTATPMVVSGSISGFVNPTLASTGTAVAYAEQNGKIIKGTPVAADGSFKLSPLVQSSTNGNYDVIVSANGYSSAVIKTVPVVATQNVTVSTQAAPITTAAATTRMVSGLALSTAGDPVAVNGMQTSSGTTYTVNTTNAMLDTGAYSLSLSAGAPYVGVYSTTLPVTLAADTSVAGQYQIKAENLVTGAASQATPVDVSQADKVDVNFNF